MNKKTSNLVSLYLGNQAASNPAFVALIEFASQNSGIDYTNYGERASFRAEQRSITADFKRFVAAMGEAVGVGVTDKQIIENAPYAFSGRLEWKLPPHNSDGVSSGLIAPHWEYCTGQYFPTEYRKAAASLLERATAEVKRGREPQKRTVATIAELKQLNADNGGHFFDRDSMKFFRSRVESEIIAGRYFITSEQYNDETRRLFTLRSFNEQGDIDTLGKFQAHKSKQEAKAAIPREQAQAA